MRNAPGGIPGLDWFGGETDMEKRISLLITFATALGLLCSGPVLAKKSYLNSVNSRRDCTSTSLQRNFFDIS